MNERINGLWWKARIGYNNQNCDPEVLEKFAELIVKECMLQCIKVENDVELSDYEGGFKDGALLCYQEIQEHFGVEE